MGRGFLQLLGGRPLILVLFRRPLIGRGRPREEVSLVVVRLLHLGGTDDGLLVGMGVVAVFGRGSERLVDGLERGRVVPVGLVFLVVVLESVRASGRFRAGWGDRDHRFGLAPHGHVLLARRSARGRCVLRLVPLDVLDRSEELVEILEQIVALVLVVGH